MAFRCLKPGGKLAIISAENNPEMFLRVPELMPDDEIEFNRSPFLPIRKSEAESMSEQAGFVIEWSELFQYEYTFPSLDYFLTWCCSSLYVDESKILPDKKDEFAREFVNDDGMIKADMAKAMYEIIAIKPEHEM